MLHSMGSQRVGQDLVVNNNHNIILTRGGMPRHMSYSIV